MMQSARRRRWRVARLAALLILLAGAAPADEIGPALPTSWGLHEAVDLRFRVMLPPNPVRTEKVRETWVGKVSELMLDAAVPGAEFSVHVRNLPRAARWLVTTSYIFSEVKDGLLKGGTRPELSDVPITRDGFPGRHIRFEDPERGDWVEDVLVLLAKDKLYFVVAAREREAGDGLPVAAFFDSFSLW